MNRNNQVQILMADDDADDRILMKEALAESSFSNTLSFVVDGEDLLYYLSNKGKYESSPQAKPGLILLDLNMPKVSGFEALHEIRSTPHLKRIPIIVLTTSRSDEDIKRSYDLGVNSFISKPAKYKELVEVAQQIGNYWFNTVSLPTIR
jgi:two-component system response regulator